MNLNVKTVIGLVLIAFGIVALVYEGFSYTEDEQVMKVGPIEATVSQEETVSIPPVAGGLAIVAGTAFILIGRNG